MSDRQDTIEMIDEALASGARLSKACDVLGLSQRTIQRWRYNLFDARKAAASKRQVANKLTDKERDQILKICNQGQFASMSPNQIVPALADQGVYVASESSFYRVLRQADQLSPRGKAKPANHKRPQAIEASGPNQVWSWDITYLPTLVKGLWFYLYMIIDIYSRKIVGWEVFDSESADNASLLIRKTCLKEKIASKPLVLHSDNGSPMKGATMLATLQKLGVVPSFSRPSVSNDNAYSEALFKTLKYHPGYPDSPFESMEKARSWVLGFTKWYNELHRHSALKFVTPDQRHRRQDITILERRKKLYLAAREKHPQRWSGAIRNWRPDNIVYLNPNKSDRPTSMAA
jgi:transposase InsO family protein